MNNLEKEVSKLLNDIATIDVNLPIENQLNCIKDIYNIEDIQSVLENLNKIKKVNIKKILDSSTDEKEKKIKQNSIKISYTKEEVNKIFLNNGNKVLEDEYSKKEIEQMYIALTGSKPLSSYNKNQIIKRITSRYKTINRAHKIHEKFKVD